MFFVLGVFLTCSLLFWEDLGGPERRPMNQQLS